MERNGFLRTSSFTAEKFADGTSTGQLQLRSPEFDVVVHLRVDCLRVVGGQAHMSGVITYTSDPSEAFVGERNRLVVQDNGSGPHAPPDMVSGIPANPDKTTRTRKRAKTTRLRPTASSMRAMCKYRADR